MIEKDYTLASADTTESRDILGRLVREWSERFAIGQTKYSEIEHLGPAGVFPDVNRKTARIKRDIWEVLPPPEGAEPTREVILDVIGHLFLMLHLYDKERTEPAPRVRLSLHTGADRLMEQMSGFNYPKSPVTMHKTYSRGPVVRDLSGYAGADDVPTFIQEAKPIDTRSHAVVEPDGEVSAGSGWEDMGPELQQAIRDIDGGHEVESYPKLREAASAYLDRVEDDRDEPDGV